MDQWVVTAVAWFQRRVQIAVCHVQEGFSLLRTGVGQNGTEYRARPWTTRQWCQNLGVGRGRVGREKRRISFRFVMSQRYYQSLLLMQPRLPQRELVSLQKPQPTFRNQEDIRNSQVQHVHVIACTWKMFARSQNEQLGVRWIKVVRRKFQPKAEVIYKQRKLIDARPQNVKLQTQNISSIFKTAPTRGEHESKHQKRTLLGASATDKSGD